MITVSTAILAQVTREVCLGPKAVMGGVETSQRSRACRTDEPARGMILSEIFAGLSRRSLPSCLERISVCMHSKNRFVYQTPVCFDYFRILGG